MTSIPALLAHGVIAALLVPSMLSAAPNIAEQLALPNESAHRDGDDLLTAGLGIDGLRGPIPALADPHAPTFAELRRRAVWTNWRGIADLSPNGGLEALVSNFSAVPGREFHGAATVPGATHPHRLLLQLPDTFDRAQPCLVVTASSGSRGVYGAIALAGGWGLPRGCAVAYTDKGAGTDWQRVGADTVSVPHAHSGDHPEADWGLHVLQAAAFGRDVLVRETGIDTDALMVIAAGLSNGAGAVLRAAGQTEAMPEAPRLDGVVAVAPNIHSPGAPSLYAVAVEAALWMPCALGATAFADDPLVQPGGSPSAAQQQGCADLAALHRFSSAELNASTDIAAQSEGALAVLHRSGWTDAALRAGALSVAFDLWRAVGAGYASAYLRQGPDSMPAGYRYAVRDASGATPPATMAEAALWWSDASGIPPGNGVVLLDPPGDSGRRDGLAALAALMENPDLQAAIADTEAAAPRPDLPILLLHGIDDGLVPEATTSAPYADFARSHGATLRYWRIPRGQHFDAFLGQPALAARYVPLMPSAYEALDALMAHLREGKSLPEDRP